MGCNKWNTNFCLDIPFGKTGLPFQMIRCSRKFSTGTRSKPVLHLLFNRIFWKLGRFPFNQNFQKRGQPRDVYPNFSKNSIQLCSRNFRLNGSHFENLTVSGIFGNFSKKFLYHLPLFWLNGKRSMLLTLILDLLKLNSICTSNYLWPIQGRI